MSRVGPETRDSITRKGSRHCLNASDRPDQPIADRTADQSGEEAAEYGLVDRVLENRKELSSEEEDKDSENNSGA